jgi:hypothetical protein
VTAVGIHKADELEIQFGDRADWTRRQIGWRNYDERN